VDLRTFFRALQLTIGIAVRKPEDLVPRTPLGEFLTRVIELVAADEIDDLMLAQCQLGKDRDVRADEANLDSRIRSLEPASTLDVAWERRRARVHDHQVVILGNRQHVFDRLAMRGRVHQRAARHERRGLSQPRRIPERRHLSFCLVSCARAAVKSIERRRTKEQGSQGHITSAARNSGGLLFV
jgi:hypothetical protein